MPRSKPRDEKVDQSADALDMLVHTEGVVSGALKHLTELQDLVWVNHDSLSTAQERLSFLEKRLVELQKHLSGKVRAGLAKRESERAKHGKEEGKKS